MASSVSLVTTALSASFSRPAAFLDSCPSPAATGALARLVSRFCRFASFVLSMRYESLERSSPPSIMPSPSCLSLAVPSASAGAKVAIANRNDKAHATRQPNALRSVMTNTRPPPRFPRRG